MNSGTSDWKAPPPFLTHQAMTVGGEGSRGLGGQGLFGKQLRMDLSLLEKPRAGLPMATSAHSSHLDVRKGKGHWLCQEAPHRFGKCTPAWSLGLENSSKPGTALCPGQRGHSGKPTDRNGRGSSHPGATLPPRQRAVCPEAKTAAARGFWKAGVEGLPGSRGGAC